METTIKLYSLHYNNAKTYLAASLFVIGNILLPQITHLVPLGGKVLLPIYFFTLIGAYKYGWKAGVLTAILSPLINSMLFGMPPVAVLPAIMTKSVLLSFSAAIAARYYKRVSIPILTFVVLAYQTVGTLAEWAMIGNFYDALQDFRIGLPGMAIQIFGSYLFLNHIIRK